MVETIHTKSTLAERVNALAPFVGNTPLFDISHLQDNPEVKIFAKLEWNQLSNSVKARAAYRIIKEAIDMGLVNENKGIIDASSGNTAVAYATIGANIGLPITLCVPENASPQKRAALKALGANMIYTSKFGTTDVAQEKAKELSIAHPDQYYYADQYANENNWKAHYYSTALEIWEQTQGQITHYVAGLGTTGTFIGTSRRLKELNPMISLTSLQPECAMHGLEGWKHLESAMVPKIYDETIADQNLFVDTMDAYDMIKTAALKTGLLLSPSSAANLVGALRVAESIDAGTIVTIFPDHAANYPEILEQVL
jgi:cysteine synthase B